ncbi:MAG: PilZ domain-containing protein [Desulfosarcina sp.]
MHGPHWHAERKKILTRLSIAIYKMTDEQLIALLHLFKELDFRGLDPRDKKTFMNMPQPSAGGTVAPRERQLLIARFFLLINGLSEADLLEFMNRYDEKQFSMLREFPRVPCNITLDLAANGRAINCFAMDISAGGMFVESCEPFSVGQLVSICFSVTDDHLALKLKGRVIRIEHDGVGIRYEALTGYQQEIMKDWINRLHRRISTQSRDR